MVDALRIALTLSVVIVVNVVNTVIKWFLVKLTVKVCHLVLFLYFCFLKEMMDI